MLIEMYRKEYNKEEMTPETLQEAIEGGWQVQAIDDKVVVGSCDTCKSLIIEGNEYMMYEEDICLCEECK